jgi:S1-C subfamily serine protease
LTVTARRKSLPTFGQAAHSLAVSPWFRLSLLALCASACASSQYPDIDEPMPPGVKTSVDSPAPALPDVAGSAQSTPQSPGMLQRADVERMVDAGFARFLRHVEVEPSVSAGKFKGWSIVSLQPPELWSGIDLRPGDVITRVNGMPIERETEAFDAFQAVRAAEKLEVSYVRQSQPRTLTYVIVGKPSPALPKAPPEQPKAGG